ncbi:DnaJ-class molecular chaperone [Prescottella agglutinans]|uniref:DnaJ-class molecular chaperone n=1 Tax=Prescottella agglutinans TaxID=1644129 RepID=A0ABT6MKT4_9NOCA|nr:DnaJ-class molecular chaperone [Prescottella agglutinans]
MECYKCFRKVHECSTCKGYAGKTCRKCNGTGYVCGTHDGFWKR